MTIGAFFLQCVELVNQVQTETRRLSGPRTAQFNLLSGEKRDLIKMNRLASKKQRARVSSRSARAQSGQQIPLWIWIAGGGLLAILLVGGLLYLGYGASAGGGNIEGLEVFADPGRGHQEGDLEYSQLVPVGGIHNSTWQNCGIYDQPLRTENVLHSMEHGAVWVAYQPDLPAEQVEILRNIVRQEQDRRGERLIVLAPKPDLETPIVATAWRAQMTLDDASDERLTGFLARYQRGPYYPEPGATCTFGGIGEPLS